MEPTITFGINNTGTDTPWSYAGSGSPEVGGWKEITPSTDTLCFMGGSIDDADLANSGVNALGLTTIASGTRRQTIRPSSSSYVIPYVYVEKELMYYAKFCGHNAYRYAMGVYVDGTATSDLYMEAWDDNTFSTTALEILTGTTNSGDNSLINAIRTTEGAPPWAPGWDGGDVGAAYLRGDTYRVALANASSITDQAVYYNMYIRLQTDCSTFHVVPVLAFRYLYT